jgi:predicted nuclease of predicted toxin-antitoxin system
VKLLLDNGLPRSTVAALADFGIVAEHVGSLGMADSDDDVLIAYAFAHDLVAVTLDADFHTLMAVSGAVRPSVIRVRIEGLKGPAMAAILARVLNLYAAELTAGAVVSVNPTKARCRLLPLT